MRAKSCTETLFFIALQSLRTVTDLYYIEISRIADLFLVCFTYPLDKGINSFILDNAYGTSAKAGTGHTGSNDTIYLPCFLYQSIQLDTGYFIIIPQGYVGCVHQFTKQLHIIVLQRFYRTDRSLILIYCMLCTLSADITLDNSCLLYTSDAADE